MARYPKYKDSGAEWIGDIPSHWLIRDLKFNTYIKARVGWHGLKSDEFSKEGAYCVTGTDFENGAVKWEECYRVSIDRYDEDPYIQLRLGDLLITKDGTIGKTAVVKSLPGPATLNSGVFVVRPTKDYSSDFLYWQLQSNVFSEFVNYNSKGSTIIHLYQDTFCNLPLLIPPEAEQKAITIYLDKKTKLIDETISKKQRLIELLQEERTAMINQAVTRGLDPKVKLKPSGVEWLGDIPEHWEVKKLKYILTNVRSGDGINSEEIVPGGKYPVYGGNGVMGYTNKFNSTDLDIIIGRVGAKCGNIRLVDGSKWVSDNALIAKTNNIKEFVAITLTNFNLNRLANQNAQPLITSSMVKEQYIPIPNLEVQKRIINHINKQCLEIDLAINQNEKLIDLLQEYRTALINEVVTGKLCVLQ